MKKVVCFFLILKILKGSGVKSNLRKDYLLTEAICACLVIYEESVPNINSILFNSVSNTSYGSSETIRHPAGLASGHSFTEVLHDAALNMRLLHIK
jgi:hypothetical protein